MLPKPAKRIDFTGVGVVIAVPLSGVKDISKGKRRFQKGKGGVVARKGLPPLAKKQGWGGGPGVREGSEKEEEKGPVEGGGGQKQVTNIGNVFRKPRSFLDTSWGDRKEKIRKIGLRGGKE